MPTRKKPASKPKKVGLHIVRPFGSFLAERFEFRKSAVIVTGVLVSVMSIATLLLIRAAAPVIVSDTVRAARTPAGLGPDQTSFVGSSFADDIQIRIKPIVIQGPEGYFYEVGVSYESAPDGVGAYVGIQHNGAIRARAAGVTQYYGDISLFASWANYGAQSNDTFLDPALYYNSSCESAGFDGGSAQGCGVYIPYAIAQGQEYILRVARSMASDAQGMVWLAATVENTQGGGIVAIGKIKVPASYGKIRYSGSFKEAFNGSSERCSYTSNSAHEVYGAKSDGVFTGNLVGSDYSDIRVKRAYECVHIGYKVGDGWGARTFEFDTEDEARVLENCFIAKLCLPDGTKIASLCPMGQIGTPPNCLTPTPNVTSTPAPAATPTTIPIPTVTPLITPNPTPNCSKVGDINCDGRVNAIDLQSILANYGKRTALRSSGDLTGDGIVNIFDLSQVLQGWGK